MPDDFFATLDAEIAVALAKTKSRDDAEALRKKSLNMRLSQTERARASSEWKEIKALLDDEQWQVISLIALFTEQSCDGCGSVHTMFMQYMELQRMTKRQSTQRWVRALSPNFSLNRETLIQPVTTHICAHCSEDHGFSLDSASRLAQRDHADGPSTSYSQDDINAAA